MYKIVSSFALSSFLVASLGSAATPIESILGEDTDALLSFRSVAELRETWEAHPFAELVEDPALQAFFTPWLDLETEEGERFSDVLEDEFELTVDELFELFPGHVSLSLHNLPELMMETEDDPDLALIAEFSGDAARLEELMEIQFERNAESHKELNPESEHTMLEERFMGETLHFDEAFDGENSYVEDGYALVDGYFILATPESRLRLIVEAIKDEAESPLADNAVYQRSQEQGGRGDVRLYFNLESMMPPLNEWLLDQSMENGGAMLGLTGNSLDKALSLETWQAFFLDLDLIESGMRAHSGFIYTEKSGLLSLLTYSGKPLPEAPYVPSDVFSTSISTFDLAAMLAQLESLLGAASPSAPMLIDMQMQSIQTQTGVDLRRSVLENLGDEFVSLSILPEEALDAAGVLEPEQIILCSVRDGESLSSAFEALKDLAPGMRELIETQEFAGETIHTIKGTPPVHAPDTPVTDVSYVVTRSHFILSVGRVGLLHEVLTAMEAEDAGFWQSEEVEAFFAEIAMPGAVTRSYVNLEQMVVPLLQSMVEGSQMAGDATALKMEDVPQDLDVPFHFISEMNEAPDGFFTRLLILKQ